METIFDLCTPRADVIAGRLKDEEFAADLASVVREDAARPAPDEYRDPKLFFRHSHPTRGMRTLLESVCRRLSGKGGELNSVIRLDTQYGGGKTHSLIALVHAIKGLQGVERPEEFLDPSLLPKGRVRVAALDGENADPANGLRLEEGVLARSIWGEMAYRLAGRRGYERVRQSDERHVAPGADTIVELFGGDPALILIDEISVYLRKVSQAFPEATGQFSAFIQALIKAVSSTPRAALVCTLAVRAKDQEASDAYRAEHQRAVSAFEEAESIVSRKLLQLDPTEEDETVDVLRRRMFEKVDLARADRVLQAYFDLWERNRQSLPSISPETKDQFRRGYPFHPETLNVLVKKMSSLSTFQRTRGMLRLLSRTIHNLWRTRPPDAFSIHPHHVDLAFNAIRQELTTRLQQSAFAPALAADVASVSGKDPATAQRIDQERDTGQPPVATYVAGTIFLNTLAFGEAAQGIAADHLRFSVCSPTVEPSFVDQARKQFVEDSLYLDDRPGAPLRFRVEPNLTQIINRAMKEVDPEEVDAELSAQLKGLFRGKAGEFELVPFPAAPHEIPDDTGDGRPYLALLHYEAYAVSETLASLPPDLVRMATRKGVHEELRVHQNNVVFVVADERFREEMKAGMRRRLALIRIKGSDTFQELPEYQQRRIDEELEKSRTKVAIAALQCYRHLFYPSATPFSAGDARLGHTTVELQNASDSPGNGQVHVKRALRDQRKLLAADDEPDSPAFVRQQTALRTKGEISTAELRSEYRKAPNLSVLLDDGPLIACIRRGIAQDVFVYRKDDQVWGPGEPAPAITISDNTFVHTMEHARKHGLWPRRTKEEPAPEPAAAGRGSAAGTKPAGIAAASPAGAAAAKPSGTLTGEGPLRKALTDVFEKARKEKVDGLAWIAIRFFQPTAAWNLHNALASYRDADVSCNFQAGMSDEGIENFTVTFSGTYARGSQVKSLVEKPLLAAKSTSFEAQYRLSFKAPLSTSDGVASAFIAAMTKFGAADAFVEAEAAPKGGK